MIAQATSRSKRVAVRVNVLTLSIGWFVEALDSDKQVIAYGFFSSDDNAIEPSINKVDAYASELATAAHLEFIYYEQ